MEHYSDLYSPAALDGIDCLPTMDEFDSGPSAKELSNVTDSLASGKARGNDWIHHELISYNVSLPYCYHCTKSFASAAKK